MSEVELVTRLREFVDGTRGPYTNIACDIGKVCDALEAAEAQVAALTKAKDEAYAERNKLVSYLARLYPSGTMRTDIPGWDAEWHGCVFIDTPQGQMSWHYHDSEAHLFADLPSYHGEWDGHTTEEKYRRLKALEEASR